jgi:hypothetical protein
VNEIGNALAVPVEDPVSNNILRNTLEVCNKGDIRKKTQTPFNCVLVFHFQKMQRRFRRIVAHCGCCERVAEDVYRTTETSPGLNFGAGTSSAVVRQDDYPDLGHSDM